MLKNVQIQMSLELLDRDELEWVLSGLQGLLGGCNVKGITLSAYSESPDCVTDFEELLQLRRQGFKVDGRLYREHIVFAEMIISSIWPPFAHWGKHRWLRETLLDSSGTHEVSNNLPLKIR